MIKWLRHWAFPVATVVVLVVGISLQVLAGRKPVLEGTLNIPLVEAIPYEFPGWTVENLDLGATESVTERSHNLLKLDDFVHREYRREGQTFSVYVAYWKPGKMPVRLVNQHTPDRCWTEVGWTCADREWNVAFSVGDQELQPAQWGIYELGDFRQHTYFWHIVGGRVHWYGGERMNTRSSISSIWEDFMKYGLNVHREQFFIRIVSPDPLDTLWEEKVFLEVMDDLAKLCLAEPGSMEEIVSK